MVLPSPKKIFLLVPAAIVAATALYWLCWLAEVRIPGLTGGDDSRVMRWIYAGFFLISVVDCIGTAPRQSPDWWMVPGKLALSWAVVPISIFVARVLFPILSCGVLDPSAGIVLGPLAVALYYGRYAAAATRNPFAFLRGAKRLTNRERARAIAKAEREVTGSSEPSIRWAGIALPSTVSDGHFTVAGTIGSGKTLMHRELMASVLPTITPGSDRRAILYDVKGESLSFLDALSIPAKRVTVLNPFDVRSTAWDIAGDIRSPRDVDQAAASIIPERPNEHDAFFSNAARDVLREVLNVFVEHSPGHWTLRDLIHITASPARLASVLEKTRNGADFLAQYRSPPATFGNFVQHLGTALRPLRTVAALWDHTPNKISLTAWTEREESILVLDGRQDHRASLLTINRLMFNHLSPLLTSGRESPNRSRFWVFLDELQDASRLEGLMPLLNLGRSKGVRCALGFQDLEGLHLAYGQSEGDKLASLARNVSFLKLTSTRTAKWASERLGEVERMEHMRSWSVTTTVSEHLQKREAVLPSEILHLQDPVSTDAGASVRGFHVIKGIAGIIDHASTFKTYAPDPAKDFVPRPLREQTLSPWSEADAARLGITVEAPDLRCSARDSRTHTQTEIAEPTPVQARHEAKDGRAPVLDAQSLDAIADFTLPDD